MVPTHPSRTKHYRPLSCTPTLALANFLDSTLLTKEIMLVFVHRYLSAMGSQQTELLKYLESCENKEQGVVAYAQRHRSVLMFWVVLALFFVGLFVFVVTQRTSTFEHLRLKKWRL